MRQSIVDPWGYVPDGTETRLEVINAALIAVREVEGTANYVTVGRWIDHYLTLWEDARTDIYE